MFILAHLITGLIIGKLSGNYTAALIGSLAVDLDHLAVYILHKILSSPKKFWQTVINPDDSYGNQRNFLHSFFAWLPVSGIATAINFGAGVAFSISYLVHLLLDMIDSSDFHPLYPIRLNIKGPIRYLSKSEIAFTFVMFFVFLLL